MAAISLACAPAWPGPSCGNRSARGALAHHSLSAPKNRRKAVSIRAEAAEAGAPPAPLAAVAGAALYTTHSWLWKGHKINYATAGCGRPVLLVHGFGASVRHYRATIPWLVSQGYKVYAVDLLGQGASDKPVLQYTMELWRDQLLSFMEEFVGAPCVVMGNSIGSLASLMSAAAAPERVAGVVLLNCAGGMNNKAISDDWRIKLAMPIFLLIDSLLRNPSVAAYIFERFRTRDNIRSVLLGVYCNQAAVDEELVELIYGPSCDEGALDVFVSIITGPPGPRPEELVPQFGGPLMLLWGDADTFTPADGPVGRYFQALPQQRPGTQFVFLPDTGHCPQDDRPELVHAALQPWLEHHHA